MDHLPRRQPLTDEGALKTPLRPLLDRVDAFTRRHPEITVSAPYNNFSGLWEVHTKGGVSQWDNGHRMMDELEERHP
jgi:hypothetical protein